MTVQDTRLIRAIAARAMQLYERFGIEDLKIEYIVAELSIVHEEIIRLRLREFLEGNAVDFSHDIGGIHRHLEFGRDHARLSDGFLPRFAEVS